MEDGTRPSIRNFSIQLPLPEMIRKSRILLFRALYGKTQCQSNASSHWQAYHVLFLKNFTEHSFRARSKSMWRISITCHSQVLCLMALVGQKLSPSVVCTKFFPCSFQTSGTFILVLKWVFFAFWCFITFYELVCDTVFTMALLKGGLRMKFS